MMSRAQPYYSSSRGRAKGGGGAGGRGGICFTAWLPALVEDVLCILETVPPSLPTRARPPRLSVCIGGPLLCGCGGEGCSGIPARSLTFLMALYSWVYPGAGDAALASLCLSRSPPGILIFFSSRCYGVWLSWVRVVPVDEGFGMVFWRCRLYGWCRVELLRNCSKDRRKLVDSYKLFNTKYDSGIHHHYLSHYTNIVFVY